VVHPGIDTRVFKPLTDPSVSIDLPDLSDAAHVITCTVNFSLRDTEFQLFMTSLSSVLKHKPGAHVIVIESEWVHADYAGYDVVAPQLIKAKICDTFGLNPGHIHFPETMIHDHYIKLLQASNIHVCLDSPMMISYSMLQAMSCECIVIAPDTPPAREIITDGNNGILADFSTPDNMGRKILACLDYPSFIKPVQKKARQTVVGRFAVEKTLSGYLTIIQNLVRKSYNSHFG
jgi:glycosyltransferase involved in cell wall biosynthesis